MATKTISVDLEAYERLRAARMRPDESFSQVIRRGHWKTPRSTGAALLRALEATPPLPARVIARLERIQQTDAPPDDAWNG